MMPFKNCPAQVIELVPARLAFISLTMGWVSMKSPLVHEGGTTIRTAHAIRPAQLTYNLKALGAINQMLNIDHAPIVPAMALFVTSLKSVKSLDIERSITMPGLDEIAYFGAILG
jgi:hypothetical protein